MITLLVVAIVLVFGALFFDPFNGDWGNRK